MFAKRPTTVLNFLIFNYSMGGCLNTIFRALWVNDRPEEELVETHQYVLDIRNMIETIIIIIMARMHLRNFQDRFKLISIGKQRWDP